MSVVVLFGVCGCGKSTVGRALAEKLNCNFADADDWHPESNVEKMSSGIPLTDQDRLPWLQRLHGLLSSWYEGGVTSPVQGVYGVLACSALKRNYRDMLAGRRDQGSASCGAVIKRCVFVLLEVSEGELEQRVGARDGHFMPTSLIRSQLEALEPPEEGEELTVAIETDGLGVDEIVMKIIDKLKHMTIINELIN